MATTMKAFLLTLRIAGSIVSAALVALGICLLIKDKSSTSGLNGFCKVVSTSLVFVALGLIGCYVEAYPHTREDEEAKGYFKETRGFAYTLYRRMVVVLFYFWLGASIIGEVGGVVLPGSGWSKVLGLGVGFVAWTVAACRLGSICLSEEENSEEGEKLTSASAQGYGA
mmetsp:Transcript_101989/g.264163  ORF Transcript_101989/g.264163 Transcript_101989/m.264163 type:complete len:169 (-) Transcript_101989:94-600(-)